MSNKQLKIWNGRGWKDIEHWYGAAYSIIDLIHLLKLAGNSWASYREIREYSNKDCWGVRINGIKCERGIWVLKKGAVSVEKVI